MHRISGISLCLAAAALMTSCLSAVKPDGGHGIITFTPVLGTEVRSGDSDKPFPEDMDFGMCYPLSDFNRRTVMWDLNYFKYCFLKATGINFNESNLEDDFEEMTDILLSASSDTFMYRDFQSRNVIIKDEKPYFIDFQGGRKGPIYYDVASFLWQAKANFNSEIREEMIETYISEANKFTEINSEEFKKTLHHFVVFRTMQVLGAYGFRGLFERKTHFIESIPYALNNLQTLFKEHSKEYPYLSKLLMQLSEMDINDITTLKQ